MKLKQYATCKWLLLAAQNCSALSVWFNYPLIIQISLWKINSVLIQKLQTCSSCYCSSLHAFRMQFCHVWKFLIDSNHVNDAENRTLILSMLNKKEARSNRRKPFTTSSTYSVNARNWIFDQTTNSHNLVKNFRCTYWKCISKKKNKREKIIFPGANTCVSWLIFLLTCEFYLL